MADTKWRKYESLVLYSGELELDEIEALIERTREILTNAGAKILKTERWGMRDMAFELKKNTRAYYLLLEFAGLGEAATEYERRLNLIDTILKFQTIKLEDGLDAADIPDEEIVVSNEPSEEAAPEVTEEAEAAEESAGEEAPAEEASEEAAPEATEEAEAAEEPAKENDK